MRDGLPGATASIPQCWAELPIGEGVEDVERSAFASVFARIGPGCYDTPDGDELWKLLLVIALHQIRGKATDQHAAKRDSHRPISGVKTRTHLESQVNVRVPWYAHLELVLEEREETRRKREGHA